MCLRLDAKLGQCKLLDSVVLFYGRPFFQVAGSIALGLELPGFQGWSCQAFRGPLLKPNSIIKTVGLPLQETANTVGEARLHPGWLTRPSEVQEGLACANCMASARGSEAFAWHLRSARAGSERDSERGFACLCLCPCVAPVLGLSRNSNAVALPFADACCVASVSP